MGCKFDEEILERSVKERISQLERFFMTEHLKSCPDCRDRLRQLKKAQSRMPMAERLRKVKKEHVLMVVKKVPWKMILRVLQSK